MKPFSEGKFSATTNYKIFPLGDAALTVEFGNEISAETNDLVLNLARRLDTRAFAGLIEIVPAYASLTIFYNVSAVRRNFPRFPAAFDAVSDFVARLLRSAADYVRADARAVEIPVCFDRAYALDLDFVADRAGLSSAAVIEIFLERTYRVYMLGFLPGFAYMGAVDERIAAPRKSAPRLTVPRGSVGIANRQTGIYSLDSPGGWQIVGRTPVEMFTPRAAEPTFLRAGDAVKFYATDF